MPKDPANPRNRRITIVLLRGTGESQQAASGAAPSGGAASPPPGLAGPGSLPPGLTGPGAAPAPLPMTLPPATVKKGG